MVIKLGILWVLALMIAMIAVSGAASKKAQNAPLNIGVSASVGQIYQQDPKLPGKYLWKIWAKGAQGASENNSYQGTLIGITAMLFEKGKLAAKMKAPKAVGNSATQTIVATGRVTVTSLQQPGTTLKADKITWHAKTNKIVATGNVIYHNAKNGVTMRVPSLNADTVLKSLSFGMGNGTLK